MLEPEKMDGGKKNVFQFALKLVGRFLIFLAVLFFIGWAVLAKMENLLTHEIENFVAKYAAMTAQVATERFDGEMVQNGSLRKTTCRREYDCRKFSFLDELERARDDFRNL